MKFPLFNNLNVKTTFSCISMPIPPSDLSLLAGYLYIVPTYSGKAPKKTSIRYYLLSLMSYLEMGATIHKEKIVFLYIIGNLKSANRKKLHLKFIFKNACT